MTSTAGLAKNIDLTGTVDCGLKSGALCSPGDALKIWTRDIDGARRRVTIDVTPPGRVAASPSGSAETFGAGIPIPCTGRTMSERARLLPE